MARKDRRRGKVAELKPGERLWAVVVDASDFFSPIGGRGIRCPSMVAMFTVGADGVPDYDDPDAEEVRSFFLGKTI